ncbi:hypothetical protein ACCD10_27805 [Pseudomonas sp. Pseusp122]|uniref:hypothetical protein n=1 Tax=unclassified Pseudomonas TaxID=196821 RepID=UPI0039A550E9
MRCADKDFRDLSDKKVKDAKSTLDAQFAADDYQPIKATADSTFDLSNIINTSSTFGGSCPVLQTVSVPWFSGSVSFNPNVNGLCTFLTFMGYIMVAFAMRKAAEIVADGV